MPNSDSTITRTELLRGSFRQIGMDEPSVDDLAIGVGILNDLVAELDGEGRWLWTIDHTESTLLLIASQREYEVGVGASQIPAYIQSLETAVLGTSRKPLRIIGKTEATTSFELETTSGEPYLIHLEVAADPANQKLILLPTPSTAETVYFTYQRMLYDLDAGSDNPDVKRSMRRGLKFILAADLAAEFGCPLDKRQFIEAKALDARKLLRRHNEQKADPTRAVPEYF